MINNTKYGYSILFVEDEIELRKNYVMYLQMIFETVYEAGDGEEAYGIYKEKKPDILIVDINIPKMNGLELIEQIRKHDHIVKTLVLTAHQDKKFLLKATSLKLTDYLLKPVTRKTLQQSLEKVIDELRSYRTIAIKHKLFNDGYIWNYDSDELTNNGKIIHLTNKETTVLKLFMNNLNSVLSVGKIIYTVWDEYVEGQEASLKTILMKLRRKLPKEMIKNIHGIGYKINS